MTVNRILFSHAEVVKDVVEGFLGCDLASGDFGEGVAGEAEVFCDEVAAELLLEADEDALEVGMGIGEGFVVSG